MNYEDSSGHAQTISQVLFLETTIELKFVPEVLYAHSPFSLTGYPKDVL